MEHFLEELNEEVYHGGLISQSVLLPKAIGGASVGLLMEITSTKTKLVLVCTLPNGLGIYRTSFWDRYSSYLAYRGPYKIFSLPALKGTGTGNYVQFVVKLYKVHGELLEKAIGPEPSDPGMDSTVV